MPLLIKSTSTDNIGQASIIDSYNPEQDSLILRGFEAGPGISIVAYDSNPLDPYPNKVIRISYTGTILPNIGEANDGINLGSGATVYTGKAGISLQFRTLIAGPGINIAETPNEIEISAIGGSAGEANSGNNLGNGLPSEYQLYKDKTGVLLNFRTLIAGDGVHLGQDDKHLYISSSILGGDIRDGINLGTNGARIFEGKNGTDLRFRRLVAGSEILLQEQSDNVTISIQPNASSIRNATNIGNQGAGAEGIFYRKNLDVLEFKKLVAGNNVTLSSDMQYIYINASPILPTMTSLGSGSEIPAQVVNNDLQFRSIKGINGINTLETPTEIILSPSINWVEDVTNSGSIGISLIQDRILNNIRLKNITVGNGISLIENGNLIRINATGEYTSGDFDVSGDASTFNKLLRGYSQTLSAEELFIDGQTTRLVIPINHTWGFSGTIVARQVETGSRSKTMSIDGMASNVNNIITISYNINDLHSTTVTPWSFIVDTDNEFIRFYGLGEQNIKIRWLLNLQVTQLGGYQ